MGILRRTTFATTIVVLLPYAVSATAIGATPLTKAQYQAMLMKADARVTIVTSAAENGLKVGKSPAEMKKLLLDWAQTETQLGNSFKTTQAPTAVTAPNALLSRSEILFGKQLSTAAENLPTKVSAIGPYLDHSLGHASGPRMIDQALQQLHKAGYDTSG
jgi:hypothetical protein